LVPQITGDPAPRPPFITNVSVVQSPIASPFKEAAATIASSSVVPATAPAKTNVCEIYKNKNLKFDILMSKMFIYEKTLYEKTLYEKQFQSSESYIYFSFKRLQSVGKARGKIANSNKLELLLAQMWLKDQLYIKLGYLL
jgi:hypothetical protein